MILCSCTTSKQCCTTSLFTTVNSTFKASIYGKACTLLLFEIVRSFSCMDHILPWKSFPSSSCKNLPLSLRECTLLWLLLSLLHVLNLSLEKSDPSPSHSNSPQGVHPLSLKCFLYESLKCDSSNPWSPLSDSSLSLEINGHDLIIC
jgi:hypothetical protein